MKIILTRGLPGAGKSFWASKFKAENPRTVICCADDYFEIGGFYKFVPEKIGKAHKFCFEEFMSTIQYPPPELQIENIIIANTNSQRWEMSPYITVAEYFNYEHQILEFQCDVETSISRNVHDVPRNVIENMAKRWEKPLKNWNWKLYEPAGKI